MDDLISKIIAGAIQPAVTFLIALSVAIFIFGIIEFIAGADNEEKRNIGKKHLIWGIVGLFIMLSVLGIKASIESFVGSFE